MSGTLSARGLSKSYGGRTVVSSADLDVGDRKSVV